ncbi:hypothetical protein GGR27_003463 [Lewinella antarctica]|uniref:Uncharacterized protein n=1 Tax=Neolewinella antarctica TaxID=442734 RepID=A0ABX0XGE4_9BACT|nr:hypothetical protein [Neolewinella antarctica]
MFKKVLWLTSVGGSFKNRQRARELIFGSGGFQPLGKETNFFGGETLEERREIGPGEVIFGVSYVFFKICGSRNRLMFHRLPTLDVTQKKEITQKRAFLGYLASTTRV